jgi:hypothetical protein
VGKDVGRDLIHKVQEGLESHGNLSTTREDPRSGKNRAIFSLLLKPAAHKDKMDWNSSTRGSRLCAAPVAIPLVLWSLSLFHSI